jgi:hypothetical protein
MCLSSKTLATLAAVLAAALATASALATGGAAAAKKRCKRTDYCGHYVGTATGPALQLRVNRAGVVLVSARVALACNGGGSPSALEPTTITRRYRRKPLHVSRKGKVRSTREGQAPGGAIENLSLTGRFRSGKFKGTFRYLSKDAVQECDSGKVAVSGAR